MNNYHHHFIYLLLLLTQIYLLALNGVYSQENCMISGLQADRCNNFSSVSYGGDTIYYNYYFDSNETTIISGNFSIPDGVRLYFNGVVVFAKGSTIEFACTPFYLYEFLTCNQVYSQSMIVQTQQYFVLNFNTTLIDPSIQMGSISSFPFQLASYNKSNNYVENNNINRADIYSRSRLFILNIVNKETASPKYVHRYFIGSVDDYWVKFGFAEFNYTPAMLFNLTSNCDTISDYIYDQLTKDYPIYQTVQANSISSYSHAYDISTNISYFQFTLYPLFNISIPPEYFMDKFTSLEFVKFSCYIGYPFNKKPTFKLYVGYPPVEVPISSTATTSNPTTSTTSIPSSSSLIAPTTYYGIFTIVYLLINFINKPDELLF